jgi:hypothetical protein
MTDVSQIEKDIENNYRKFNTLTKRADQENPNVRTKLKDISRGVDQLFKDDNTLSLLDGRTISKLNHLYYNGTGQYSSLLNFTPVSSGTTTQTRIPSQTQNYDGGYQIIYKYDNNFDGRILGRDKRTKNIIDDITNFDGKPTLSIHGQGDDNPYSGYVYRVDQIGNQYVVSFDFNLRRFPSKTHQNSSRGYSMKQFTTRRSEIIRFIYDGNVNNVIEFAAMAPYSKGEGSNPYQFKYYPYSLAVSFPIDDCKHSIYTDYKFNLDTWYNVKLTIDGDAANFRDSNYFTISLYVNNVLQEISYTHNKVWSIAGKKLKKDFLVASTPGFGILNTDIAIEKEILKDTMYNISFTDGGKGEVKESKNNFPPVSMKKRFDFSTLVKIQTVPYLPMIPNYSNISDQDKYHKIYKKHLNSSNNGIDFSNVQIYYRN